MKLFYDHQIFTNQRFGGISRYFCELFRYFPAEVEVACPVLFSDNEYIRNYLSDVHSLWGNKHIKGKRLIYEYINELYDVRKIKKTEFDIFHPTYYKPYFINSIKDKPLVVTVHDMIHELYPDLFSRRDISSLWKKKCVVRADKIIAISEQTKHDLLSFWDVDEQKIEVIHHGISSIVDFEVPSGRICESPYILYLGERSGYKNWERLLQSFMIIKDVYPDLKMLCTGRSFTQEEIRNIRDKELQNRILHCRASDVQLAQLLRDAELFVYPSYSEGFGMPILEAYKFNCPAVISDIPCFREVADDAAVYFDPFDTESIANSLERVLLDNELKAGLREKGKMRMHLFPWKNTAQKTFEVYKTLL